MSTSGIWGAELGETILLVTGHCDPTADLHGWHICVRGMGACKAHVAAVRPVAARGAYF